MQNCPTVHPPQSRDLQLSRVQVSQLYTYLMQKQALRQECWEVKLPAFLGNYDRLTNAMAQLTDQPDRPSSDRPGYRELLLPTSIHLKKCSDKEQGFHGNRNFNWLHTCKKTETAQPLTYVRRSSKQSRSGPQRLCWNKWNELRKMLNSAPINRKKLKSQRFEDFLQV